jgi:hypothetical protein
VLQDFGVVGVVPFTWVKHKNSGAPAAWTNMKNINNLQIQALLALAGQPASYFTGVPADVNTLVYGIGRNKGSGTRVSTLIDSQYGFTIPVDQYSLNSTLAGNILTFTGSTTTWDNNNFTEVFDNGYESGGDVAKVLNVDGAGANSPTLLVGYLGVSDANKVDSNDAAGLWLTLNGVLESDGAVIEGAYTQWGHEHIVGTSGVTSGPAFNLGTTLATKIKDHTLAFLHTASAPAAHGTGIYYDVMNCVRGSTTDSDVGVVTHK